VTIGRQWPELVRSEKVVVLLISCVARLDELSVGAVDEVYWRVPSDELREPNRDRSVVRREAELGDDPGKPLPGAPDRRPGDRAYEFVPANTYDRLIGPKFRLQYPHDVLEHQVSGVMTSGVIGRLQAVDIDVYGDQPSIATIGPLDLLLYVHESWGPPTRAGQRVDFVGLMLRRGLGAVLGGQHPVPGSQRAVAGGSIAVCAGSDSMLR
jgi:hypothetical protein